MPTGMNYSVNKKHKEVKFLTVVWGKGYIDRFLALSLPSFLAPGNIPALAKSTQLEVVIMTRESDIKLFENIPSFKALELLCHVRFVTIDDLIVDGTYSITLSLAYARPIIACGKDMVNTHFVFMNADFVLADGSLSSLAKHIHDGRSIVLGSSYRSIAEVLEPALDNMVGSDGILNVPPRTLVGMALKYPHRTTIAKTYVHNLISSTHPNQLFWKVDDNTVLGRYFLSFMLCLKPERVIENINCFCDYYFIPELCPSGDEVMMCDSDDFFMLELQSRTQETEMLRVSSISPKDIAASLMVWATSEHLRAASYDVIFHASDIPLGIKKVQAEADGIIAEIRSHLGKPQSHRNHHYWIQGVASWEKLRKKGGLSFMPPELAVSPFNLRAKSFLLFHRMVDMVKEIYVRAHPYCRVNQLRQDIFEDIRRYGPAHSQILIVGDITFATNFLSGMTGFFDIESSTIFLNHGRDKKHQYNHIIYLPNDTHLDGNRLYRKLLENLKSGGLIHVFLSCRSVTMKPNFLSVVFSNVLEAFELGSNDCKLRIASNYPLSLAHSKRKLILMHGSLWGKVLLLPFLLASIMVNLFSSSERMSKTSKYPVAIWFRVRPSNSFEQILCHQIVRLDLNSD